MAITSDSGPPSMEAFWLKLILFFRFWGGKDRSRIEDYS